MDDVAAAGHGGQQRVVAAHMGVGEARAALLVQPVGLADRGIDVECEASITGAGTACPGPPQQFTAHRVELADMAPAEASEKRPHG